MAKVDITTAGHTVIVEDDTASLDAVATKALELWWATRDPKIDRGFGVAGQVAEQGGLYVPDFGNAEMGSKR